MTRRVKCATAISFILALSVLATSQDTPKGTETVRQKDFKRHPGVRYGPFLIHIREVDNAAWFSFRSQITTVEILNLATEAKEFDAGQLTFVDKAGRQIQAQGKSFLAPADVYHGKPSIIQPDATITLKVVFSGSLKLDKSIPAKLFYGDVLILEIIK